MMAPAMSRRPNKSLATRVCIRATIRLQTIFASECFKQRIRVLRSHFNRTREFDMPELKAISIRQPWAFSVCVGTKTIENKARKTPYRGPLVIHASGQKTELNEIARDVGKANVPSQLFAFGAAIGVADLVDVVEMNPGLEDNTSANGPICWVLANPRLFNEAVPMRGQLGIFSITGTEADRVQQAIAGAKPTNPPQQFSDFLRLYHRDETGERTRHLILTYLDLSKDDDVLRLANAAIEKHPDDALLYGARGWAKYRTIDDAEDHDDDWFFAQYDAALLDLDKAVALDDNQAMFRLWRAWICHFRGHDEKKQSDIAIGKRLNPDLNWQCVEELDDMDDGDFHFPDDDEEDDDE
jgi:hypothetical protein